MATAKTRKWGKWEADEMSFDQGGQGQIYRVRDTSGKLSGFFVLKELKNPKRRARFEHEIRAISSLAPHANVVSLVDSGIYRDFEKPSYVMPEADMSLERYVKESELPVDTLLCLFVDILRGVLHIHASGIIHRDIKPENVLMFGDVPRVSDLGLCLISEAPRVTDTEEAVGPRHYMAPELEDGQTLDVTIKADIYSLGKLLYFILSKNRRVFSREKFYGKDWSLSRQHNDDRYEFFDQIFSRSMATSPHDRFGNTAEFIQAVEKTRVRFAQHPGTVLRRKLPSLSCTWDAPLSELEELDHTDWRELLRLRHESKAPFSRAIMNAVKVKAHSSFANYLARETLRQRHAMSHADVVEFAKIVVRLNDAGGDPWFSLSESQAEIHALALETGDKVVCNNVARSRGCNRQKPLEMLAPYFELLEPSAKVDYLNKATDFSFPGKESLFLKASDTELPPDAMLWLTAGLVQCGSSECINQVVKMLRKCASAQAAQSIIGGIVLKGKPLVYEALLSAGGFGDDVTAMIKYMGELRESVDRKSNDEEDEDESEAR
jgi:serine/threonine protein kinase